MGSQIYTRLPPREGVWQVGGRASGYTPSLVPPRGGATSCLPRQLHLLTVPPRTQHNQHMPCPSSHTTQPAHAVSHLAHNTTSTCRVPPRTQHNQHMPCPAEFASYDPCARWLLELSRKGTSASGDSKVTDEGVPAVLSLLPVLTSKRYNTPV
jgi:hypothetical protein